MRLIDADVVKDLMNGLESLPWEEEVDYMVDSLPTAYDVDEVLVELWLKSFTTGEESNDDGCYTDGRFSAVPLDVAIEIVKRGGVIHEYYFTNDTVGDAVKIVKRGGENDRLRETEGG